MLNSILQSSLYRLLFLGVTFCISLLLAKILGADGFGFISLLIVNGALFQLLTGLGSDAAIIWHGSGNNLSLNATFSVAALMGFFQITLFVVLEIVSFSIFEKTLLTHQSGKMPLVNELIYYVGLVLTEKYGALYVAKNLAKRVNKILVVISFLSLMLFVLLALNFFQSVQPEFVFCSTVFFQGLIIGIAFHLRYRDLQWHQLFSVQRRSMIQFAVLVFFTNLVQFLAYRADFWIIDFYFDKKELGIYAQACQFAQLIWLAPRIVASLLVPALRSQQLMKTGQFLSLFRLVKLSSVFITIITIGIAFWMYHYFLPAEFERGFIPLVIMLPGYFLFISVTYFAAYFSAKRLLWVNFSTSVICFFIVLLLDFWLIPKFGMVGAAVANSIAYGTVAILVVLQFLQKEKISFSTLYQWKKSDLQVVQNFQLQ